MNVQRAFVIAKQRALGKAGETDAHVVAYQTRLQEMHEAYVKLRKLSRVTYRQDPNSANDVIQFLSFIQAAKMMDNEAKNAKHYLDAQQASLASLRKKEEDKPSPNATAKVEAAKAQAEAAERAYQDAKLSFMQVVKGLDKKKTAHHKRCVEQICAILTGPTMQPTWTGATHSEDTVDDDRALKEDDVQEANQADLDSFLAQSDDEDDSYQVVASGTTTGRRVIAKFEHEGNADEGEISLAVGDIVEVIDDSTEGWWTGKKADGSEGMFPVNYTEPIDEDVAADQ